MLRNTRVINPESIEEYIAVVRFSALTKALTEITSEDLISEIKNSGLRGRG